MCVNPLKGLEQKAGSPLDALPGYMRQLTKWGERADFSHDGKRILFIEKFYGDAFEIEVSTGEITPVTHHFFHGGFTRALYLANGDILLSGATSFDAADPHLNRRVKAELWVLDKSLDKAPVRLGVFCSEGPAVSRTQQRIAWTTERVQYPAEYAEGEDRVHVADISYAEGEPKLANQRLVMTTLNHPFMKEVPVRTVETQNFIPGREDYITFSLYGCMGGAQMALLNLNTGAITQISHLAGHHNEPEGIYPDGQYTLVESSRQFRGEKLRGAIQLIDIWKISLDGEEREERITHFTDYKGYKASNPVVSDDGRYIAFQMAKHGDPAGMGRGIFLIDLQAREKALGR